ncbi:MAG: acetoacetate--CoA ligase, partial [bacterium]|nr:acetoacetate--CoA ligase [bacterium]
MTKASLWAPTQDQIKATQMWRFLNECATEFTFPADYGSLYQWSIQDIESFWNKVWDFCDVRASHKGETVYKPALKFQDSQFFPEARLNYAENLLKHSNLTRKDTALTFWCEDLVQRKVTHKELYAQVSQMAQHLQSLGIKKGDRVAGFLPNIPETLIAMLATTSLGAVWASCSPDFGVQGALDRFEQIQPKVLFTADGYFYKRKTHDSLEKVRQVTEHVHSIEHVVVIEYTTESPDLKNLPKSTLWRDVLAGYTPQTLDFTPCAFDDPLFIMFSSGTTGKPKCIVHGVGGTLLQHLKEHHLHSDVRPNDRVFYFTTCGWMMWNWQVSALACDAQLMLYDGSPLHPTPSVLFDYAQAEHCTLFGTSAKFIDALQKLDLKPKETHSLNDLRMITSTGSPLAPESFHYVYEDIKEDVCLASIAGGTDIISCFGLGNPMAPVYAGELQTRGLGMAVEIFDGEGQSILDQRGELVCTKPFPPKPIGFWNDPDGSKYHNAYFDAFENVWHHGDFVKLTQHQGLIFYGRSDAVLNPGGVRIGTAEIYRQVEQIDEVLESVAVGQDWKDDVRVVLFVKLRPDISLTDDLIKHIRQHIRANTTPRHVPSKVIAVPDIPRTISGKIVELAIREIIHNRPVKNK